MTRDRYGTGSITRERSGRLRVRIPDGRGRHRSVGTRATQQEAEALQAAALDESQGMCLAGVELLSYGQRVIERWARAGQRSVAADRARWAAIVARAPFARVAIDLISRADVRDWARELPQQRATRSVVRDGERVRVDTARTLSWQTCKHALGLLGRVLAEAVDDGLLDHNPARDVRRPRRQERVEGWTWLTLTELARVFALPLTGEQRAALTVATYQGLRQGELAALSWQHVDLEAGWLVVTGSWSGATKSGRVRRIPLLAPAAAALQAWRPEADQRVGLVFAGPSGATYARGYDWGWGDRRAAGGDLPTRARIGRRVRFHDLRHTCGAHLISGSWGATWSLAEVREYLGHTSEAVTARYAHLAPDALHATARRTARRSVEGSEPAADLPRAVVLARRILSDYAAGDEGFEPATFGSGGLGEPSDHASLAATAAGLRQLAISALETIAAGDPLAHRRAVELAEGVLRADAGAAGHAAPGRPARRAAPR